MVTFPTADRSRRLLGHVWAMSEPRLSHVWAQGQRVARGFSLALGFVIAQSAYRSDGLSSGNPSVRSHVELLREQDLQGQGSGDSERAHPLPSS